MSADLPIEINGQACCLCGWPLPSFDVSFQSPYAGRYLVTIHCPVCKRIWDGDSKESVTIYEHPGNRAAHN